MRKFKAISIFFVALCWVAGTIAGGKTTPNSWVSVQIGTIGIGSVERLNNALDSVSRQNGQGLIIILDTPGGSLSDTRKMVKSMMAAKVPVVVWVGPGGARAASAGAFITMAAHVAVMAPGTNIGAATPIQASGQNIGDKNQDADTKSDVKMKALNDTVSFIESIAETRNRNVDMARSFVKFALSVTDQEALEKKVIDFRASNINELLKVIHGFEVTLEGGKKIKLNTANARVTAELETFRDKLLDIVANPNLFYLLFIAGLMGLGFEITHPGAIFPGVIGTICFIIALMATSVLPVSFAAAALVIAGVVMMIGEIFIPSLGALGIGGFIAFVLGSVFLVDPSGDAGMRISLWTIMPTAVAVAFFMALVGWLVTKVMRRKTSTGENLIISQPAVAIEDFQGSRGSIRVSGEIWQGLCEERSLDIKKNQRLKIIAINGMTASVKPWPEDTL